MILRAAALLCLLLAPQAAAAEEMFLLVAAQSTRPEAAASAASHFAATVPNGLVIAESDCGNSGSGFVFAVPVADTRDAANRALETVRKVAGGAYVKPCRVKPGSLLSLGIAAVDPSIARVPAEAVNWTDADRISTVDRLDPDTLLVVVRHFVAAPDDPLEGRRSRVLLSRGDGTTVAISDTCFRPGHATIEQGLIAMDCVREQAGSHLLHAVEVSTASGRRLLEIPRCRTPTWAGRRLLACQEEEVTADDKLVTRPKRMTIDSP